LDTHVRPILMASENVCLPVLVLVFSSVFEISCVIYLLSYSTSQRLHAGLCNPVYLVAFWCLVVLCVVFSAVL